MKNPTIASRKIFTGLLIHVFILFGAVLILAPIGIMVLGSLKTPRDASRFNLQLPPEWHFENYLTVFEKGNILQAFTNSAIITVSVVIIIVLSSALASFYLARNLGKPASKLYSFFMLGLLAPISFIPTIKLLQGLRLMGSFTGVILIFSSLNMAFSIMLFTGYFRTIPREMDEASIIDGCRPLQTFFLILFPCLVPVIVTSIIFTFMGVWNNFTIPLYFLTDSRRWPLPLMVYRFFGQYQSSWNLVFADLVVTSIPIVIVYIIAQRYIIAGMTSGAIKG
jgi:raffinose/stachyose/melibiose transport system permease protein